MLTRDSQIQPNMLIPSLWHSLGRGLETGGRRAPARRFRPRMEALEAYQLPSTFTVVLATDSGGPAGQKVTATTGDLRYCIEQADAAHAAASDTITFAATLFSTPQTISGPTGDTVTVSGGDAVGVLDITGGTVGISHLAISHGNSPVFGGGIF